MPRKNTTPDFAKKPQEFEFKLGVDTHKIVILGKRETIADYPSCKYFNGPSLVHIHLHCNGENSHEGYVNDPKTTQWVNRLLTVGAAVVSNDELFALLPAEIRALFQPENDRLRFKTAEKLAACETDEALAAELRHAYNNVENEFLKRRIEDLLSDWLQDNKLDRSFAPEEFEETVTELFNRAIAE